MAGANVRAIRSCVGRRWCAAVNGKARSVGAIAVGLRCVRCGAEQAVLCTHSAFHGVRVCFISVGDFSVRRNGRNYLTCGAATVPLGCGCGGTWVQLEGERRAVARLWHGVVDSRLQIALPKKDTGPRGADAGG